MMMIMTANSTFIRKNGNQLLKESRILFHQRLRGSALRLGFLLNAQILKYLILNLLMNT
jgi:hypothetical protein